MKKFWIFLKRRTTCDGPPLTNLFSSKFRLNTYAFGALHHILEREKKEKGGKSHLFVQRYHSHLVVVQGRHMAPPDLVTLLDHKTWFCKQFWYS